MTSLKKIGCGLKVLIAIIYFKLYRPPQDFWSWLFGLAADPEGQFFQDKCFVYFLFYDAVERSDNAGICEISERFQFHRRPGLPKASLKRIKHAAEAEGRHWLLRQIEPIIHAPN